MVGVGGDEGECEDVGVDLDVEEFSWLMSHMARKPLAKPTAIMLAESHVTHVQRVFGAHALKAGSTYLTVNKWFMSGFARWQRMKIECTYHS